MSKRFKVFVIACFAVLPFFFFSSCYARPPKPGANFVWVKPLANPGGVVIPGHWKHVGPGKKGKVWVPGHHAPNSAFIKGHWKALPPARPGRAWVPGHYGPNGHWKYGHWR